MLCYCHWIVHKEIIWINTNIFFFRNLSLKVSFATAFIVYFSLNIGKNLTHLTDSAYGRQHLNHIYLKQIFLNWIKISLKINQYCTVDQVMAWCWGPHQAITWSNMTHIYDTIQYHYKKLSVTHWGRDKMAAIFQTTFSKAFSWMKMYQFRLRFHWSLFPRVKLTIFHPWFK